MVHGTKADVEWEAESDARSLRDATAVRSSPKRLKAAQVALKKMVEEADRTLMETRAAQGLKKAFPPEHDSSHNSSHNSSHKGGY